MIFNGARTLILRYFTEFDYVKVVVDSPQNIVFQLYFAKTDLRSSRTVSLG